MNIPDAHAPQELQFRLPVDEAHCDRAAQGLRLMAQYQYRSLARRYENIGWIRRARQGSRGLARALAAIALAASLMALWGGLANRWWCQGYFTLAAVLFVEAVALWLVLPRAERINNALRARFERYFGDRAAARLRPTRRDAPFEAVYDLRGDLLVYSRLAKGQWTQRWHRHLGKFRARGVALRTPDVLAIFPKPGTVVPAMIVLTAPDGALAAAIRALGWTIVDIDPGCGDPMARELDPPSPVR